MPIRYDISLLVIDSKQSRLCSKEGPSEYIVIMLLYLSGCPTNYVIEPTLEVRRTSQANQVSISLLL